MDNLENGYTEELDFSNLQEEMNKIKEVQPVPLEPIYEEQVVNEQPYVESVEENKETEVPTFNENPNAKVVLNKAEEVVEEEINHKDIKIDLKGNKSLMRVLLIGLVILVAIFLLPLYFHYLY